MRLLQNRRLLRSVSLALLATVSAGVALAASGDAEEWGPLLDPNTEKPGLAVGEMAPDAVVLDANGKEVKLADLYRRAPMTVVMFYRGGWCPYCTKSLAKWGKEAGRFAEHEYQVIAISPETVDHAKETKEKQHVGFKVFADHTTEAMRKYKVAFAVEPDYTKMLRDRLDVELAEWNDSEEEILPAPATYLVNAMGKIVWMHADWDYSKRATPDEVLVAAENEG